MSNKKTIALSILAVASIIAIASTATYAYFKIPVHGEFSDTSVQTSKFSVETNVNTVPGLNEKLTIIDESDISTKASTIDFTVKSTSTNDSNGEFAVYLKDLEISKNLISQYLKWDILVDGIKVQSGGFDTLSTKGVLISQTETNNTYSTFYLGTGINLADDQVKNVTVRIYLLNDPTVNQISLIDGYLSCKAGVEIYK